MVLSNTSKDVNLRSYKFTCRLSGLFFEQTKSYFDNVNTIDSCLTESNEVEMWSFGSFCHYFISVVILTLCCSHGTGKPDMKVIGRIMYIGNGTKLLTKEEWVHFNTLIYWHYVNWNTLNHLFFYYFWKSEIELFTYAPVNMIVYLYPLVLFLK